MHWDGAVSIGNILTFIGMIAAMFFGFQRFIASHLRETTAITAAINNLSRITNDLQMSVQTQNGRLGKVETQLAVQDEVERRMAIQGKRA